MSRRSTTNYDVSTLDPQTVREFVEKIIVPADVEACWEFAGRSVGAGGYKRFHDNVNGVHLSWSAHRLSLALVEPINPDLVCDHICRNRWCVNPLHLRQVPQRENLLARGSLSLPASEVKKTHCLRGHEYTPENTIVKKPRGRHCRECRKERDKKRNERGARRRKESRAAYLENMRQWRIKKRLAARAATLLAAIKESDR